MIANTVLSSQRLVPGLDIYKATDIRVGPGLVKVIFSASLTDFA